MPPTSPQTQTRAVADYGKLVGILSHDDELPGKVDKPTSEHFRQIARESCRNWLRERWPTDVSSVSQTGNETLDAAREAFLHQRVKVRRFHISYGVVVEARTTFDWPIPLREEHAGIGLIIRQWVEDAADGTVMKALDEHPEWLAAVRDARESRGAEWYNSHKSVGPFLARRGLPATPSTVNYFVHRLNGKGEPAPIPTRGAMVISYCIIPTPAEAGRHGRVITQLDAVSHWMTQDLFADALLCAKKHSDWWGAIASKLAPERFKASKFKAGRISDIDIQSDVDEAVAHKIDRKTLRERALEAQKTIKGAPLTKTERERVLAKVRQAYGRAKDKRQESAKFSDWLDAGQSETEP